MNDWVCPRLKWDDSYRPNRGRVLTAAELEKMAKFYRYANENEDHVAARTLPGVHAKGAFFTRGSGHNKFGGYTEIPDEYQEVMDRLRASTRPPRKAVPAPVDPHADRRDVRHHLARRLRSGRARGGRGARRAGHLADYLRVRGFPFGDSVENFLAAHDRIFVVEQNRDAQLRTLLTAGDQRRQGEAALDAGLRRLPAVEPPRDRRHHQPAGARARPMPSTETDRRPPAPPPNKLGPDHPRLRGRPCPRCAPAAATTRSPPPSCARSTSSTRRRT